MIIDILKEYGPIWLFYRFIYILKIKFLKFFPKLDILFEESNEIKRINLIDINVVKLEKFLKELSENDKNEIINIADNATKGKIFAFSSHLVDYGNPIQWHTHPISQVTVPNTVKWFNIPDFDEERGDIKYIWEASRFTHFYYLARAYMITKNIKYYNNFSNQLDDWLKHNEYSYGINYKDGQESALRMINTLMVYEIFKSYGLTTKNDEKNVSQLVGDSFKKVNSNFNYAYKSVKNNHTLSEIAAKIIGYWCSMEDKKVKETYLLFNEVLDEQFKDDGGYIQKSFNYQRFAIHIVEFVLSISEKTNGHITDDNKSKITNSLLQLYNMTNTQGELPNYGHNDGALVFPTTSCDFVDYRPVINSVYTLLNNKRLYKHGKYDEEILWFQSNNIDVQHLTIPRISQQYEDSGLHYYFTEESQVLLVSNDFKTRPSHMDQLHIDVWHKDLNIFCDTGTYSYATDLGKINILNQQHNTIKVENTNQMKLRGNFFVYKWTKLKNLIYRENFFQGTIQSKLGYKHIREVFFSNNLNEINIIDQVISDGESMYIEFYLHTPCEIKLVDNKITLFYQGYSYAEIVTDDDLEIKQTFRSRYYYNKELINKIIISSNRNMINTKIILL